MEQMKPGRVLQSATCMATDACLTADPGVASLIPTSHTSVVSLLPPAKSFKKVCCLLQAKVCARSTGEITCSSLPRKKCAGLGELTIYLLTGT